VFDSGNNLRGVAAMDIQLNVITDIVSNIRIGTTGYAFLVDKGNRLIAFPQAGYKDFGATPETLPLGDTINKEKLAAVPDDFFSILSKVSAGQSGLETITIGNLERFIAYRPIPEIGYGLIVLVPAEELQTEARAANEQIAIETRNTIGFSILLVAAILVIASIIALATGNALTAPLKTLTNTAKEITGGNLEARVEIKSRDEIGILAKTLNTMTSTLSGLIQSLEQRVAERTADLEIARQQSERRVHELQTIGEISGIISSEQKTETLLPLITRLVSERFDFYHVGIFLVDETSQWAVLQAANSEGGQSMLARGHKLEVGATGIVGYVT
jgi:methyl-accepting chemotaxis protein